MISTLAPPNRLPLTHPPGAGVVQRHKCHRQGCRWGVGIPHLAQPRAPGAKCTAMCFFCLWIEEITKKILFIWGFSKTCQRSEERNRNVFDDCWGESGRVAVMARISSKIQVIFVGQIIFAPRKCYEKIIRKKEHNAILYNFIFWLSF